MLVLIQWEIMKIHLYFFNHHNSQDKIHLNFNRHSNYDYFLLLNIKSYIKNFYKKMYQNSFNS